MNPFINPKKRGILLPKGSKDLADVLRSAKPITTNAQSDPLRKYAQEWVHSNLLQSRERRATELSIGPDSDEDRTDCTVTERIDGRRHYVTTVPPDFRSLLVEELLRMAAFTGDQFPGVGLLSLQVRRKRLMWRIDMETPVSQCVLTPLPE